MEQPLKTYTFFAGMARLNDVFERVMETRCTCENNGDLCAFCEAREAEQTADRPEIECARCEEFPCLCGDVDFESFNSAELRKAEETE
jgi:hypothetical protein